jgi:hypothetical protein
VAAESVRALDVLAGDPRRDAPLAERRPALPGVVRLVGVGLANAWERNKLARKLFAEVVVFDQTVVAIVPRPEYAPFFAQTNPRPG